MRPARPTLRGAGILAAGVLLLVAAAVFASAELLFVGLILFSLPLAAMVALRAVRPEATVSRSLGPHVVAAGGVTDVSLRIEQSRPSSLGIMQWRDLVPAELEAQGPMPLNLDPRLPRGIRLTHTVRTTRRGLYPIGPLVIGRYDPFGLAFGEFPLGSVRELMVTPKVSELPGTLLDAASSEGMARQALLRFSPSADELMPRDYRPGDPMRRVHWGATARHGELMVRQEEQRNNPEVWIVFDTATEATSTHSPTFELAVEVVASLGIHLLDQGFTLGIVETGATQLAGGWEQNDASERRFAPMFQLPAGDQQLLRGLADIEQVAGGDDGEQGSGRLGTLAGMQRMGSEAMVFAVLADGPQPGVHAIASTRPPSKPAVAFLTGSNTREDDPRRIVLEEAGWLCVDIRESSGIGDAWESVLVAVGAAEGRHG